ncbi:MAG TPA: methylated-DNA--[protein]-cysteine S-methyltransferase [Streptosporangiaceae bacterium]|nr:methylated-DNA--[protein]-cysteine S-methyltransferase [Streptosporangiaceae bacterium]
MTTGPGTITAEHTVLPTRLGDLTAVRDGERLIGLYYPHHWHRPGAAAFGRRNDSGFGDLARQLEEYLAGTRIQFALPMEARGDDFQRRVWHLIGLIAYGKTASYGDLARRMGDDVTARDVGAAVGSNPLSILVPCHRVIGGDGKLTGYAGGLRRKRALLELEGALPSGLW